MIKQKNELKTEVIDSLRGGKGKVKIVHLYEGDDFHKKGRLFAHNILAPGASIGYHKHEGDYEGYYFLHGEGVFNENGVDTHVRAGDLARINTGDSHSIENTGTVDLEFIALILFD